MTREASNKIEINALICALGATEKEAAESQAQRVTL